MSMNVQMCYWMFITISHSKKMNDFFVNQWSSTDVYLNREWTGGEESADCDTGSNKDAFMQTGAHFLPHFRKHRHN